ncbi:MAG: helix-turn-helix domain-containing protein [Bacilli bacterium]|jgi:hypothetical protein|nr:helix-turn-helix domain-containing protein [Bacilli bacterium]
MNYFHIDLLENKLDRRKISILVFLYYERKNILVEELTYLLDIDKKTLLQDIKDINDSYGLVLVLINKKYLTINQDFHDVKNIIDQIYKNTYSYRLLLNLYQGVLKSAKEYAEYFHISITQFYRYLNHINDVIKKFNINIDGYYLDLVGDEKNIQYFYINYFHHTNLNLIISNSLSYCLDYTQAILVDCNKLGLTNLNVDYYYLAILLMVFIDRTNINKKIKLNKNIIIDNNKRKTFLNLRHVLLKIWDMQMKDIYPDISFREDDFIYIYFLLLDSINYDIFDGNNLLNIRSDEPFELLNKFDEFTTNSLHKIINEHHKIIEIKKILQTYLVNIFHLSKLSIFYQIKSDAIKKLVKDEAHSLYLFWLEECQYFKSHKNFKFVYLDDIAISLTMLTSSYLKNINLVKYNVLVGITGEAGYQSYLKTYLKNNVLSNINIIYIINEKIDQILIDEHKIDVVVTNFPLINDYSGVKIIQLSYLPSQQELDDLIEYLIGFKR